MEQTQVEPLLQLLTYLWNNTIIVQACYIYRFWIVEGELTLHHHNLRETYSAFAKNFLLSVHFALVQPGHLNPICLLQLIPLSKCAFAMSAKAWINTGLPFRLSVRLIVSLWPLSPMTSSSNSYNVSMWSEVNATGMRIRFVCPFLI
jgi:hypothetical protein